MILSTYTPLIVVDRELFQMLFGYVTLIKVVGPL